MKDRKKILAVTFFIGTAVAAIILGFAVTVPEGVIKVFGMDFIEEATRGSGNYNYS